MNLQKLNERRCAAQLRMNNLGVINVPTDADEKLKANARYRLAVDASMRAEQEYYSALYNTPTAELMAIATKEEL